MILDFFYGLFDPDQWSSFNAIAGVMGFLLAAFLATLVGVGKLGRAVGFVFRGFKPAKPIPIPVILHPQTEPAPAKPTPAPPDHFINVPTGRTVIGRETELAALRTNLAQSGEVQVVNSAAILAGHGGIGKSTLARAYAEAHRQDYDGVLWVSATTRQAVIDGLANLCGVFGLAVPEAAKEAHAQEVLTKLAESGQDWLLIYDNVETYADFKGLEPRGAHLIATTRQGSGWPGFTVMQTDTLGFATTDGAAVRLLMDTAERTDDAAAARDLAEALGGQPLALVMAGRLIASEGQSFADYLTDINAIIARVPQNEDYPDSVIGAVTLSYDRLTADARLVADLFAWWAPEELHAELISGAPQGQWWESAKDELPEAVRGLAQDADRVRAGLAELVDRSLILRETGGAAMHRMTAAALRAMQATRGAGDVAEAAVLLLRAVYPYDADISSEWLLCRRLTPHVRALWASGAAPKIAAMEVLLNQSAVYLDRIADYPGAIEMDRASLALKEARLPEQDRSIAVGLANLGVALFRVGDLDAALTHLDRAIALDQTHRPGSADLANSYDLQGSVLLDIGRDGDAAALARAAKRYQQALALRRGLFGRQSDPVAVSLNNLGLVRDVQGRGGGAAFRRIAGDLARGAAAGRCAVGLCAAEHRGGVAEIRAGGSGRGSAGTGAGALARGLCRTTAASGHPGRGGMADPLLSGAGAGGREPGRAGSPGKAVVQGVRL